MLSTEQVAAALGVSPQRVRQLARARALTPTKLGRGAYFWPDDAPDRLRPGKRGRPRKEKGEPKP